MTTLERGVFILWDTGSREAPDKMWFQLGVHGSCPCKSRQWVMFKELVLY